MTKPTFEEWYAQYRSVYEGDYEAWLKDTGFDGLADPKELAKRAAREDYDNWDDETFEVIRPNGLDPNGKIFAELSKSMTFEQWYAKVKQSYLNSVQKFLEGYDYEYTGIFELVGTTAEEQAEKMARNDFESNEFNAITPFRFDQVTGFFEHHKAEFAKRAVEMLKKAHPHAEFIPEMFGGDDQDVMALLTGHISADEFISNNSELTTAMIDAIGNQCFDEADILNCVDEIWLMAIGGYSAVANEILSHYKHEEIYQLAETIINDELDELDEDQHLTTQYVVQRVYEDFAVESFDNWREYINIDQAFAAARPLIMKPNGVYNTISDQASNCCGYDLAALGINQIPKKLEEMLWEQVVDELNDADTPDLFIETPVDVSYGDLDPDIEDWLYDELGNRTAEIFEEFNQRYEYEYEGEPVTLDDLIHGCYFRRLSIDDLAGLVAGTISPDEYLEDLGYQEVH